MASIEFRAVTEDEWPDFVRTDQIAFGQEPDPSRADPERRDFPLDRTVGALDQGTVVGAAGSFPFEISLPGGTTAAAAGITWVGVRPTHRRRGVLTGMMRHQLHDLHERGEPLAVLLASESIIYGRFGYGLATQCAHATIDRRHTRLVREVETPGVISMIDKEVAAKLLPEVWDRVWRQQPGELSRTADWWRLRVGTEHDKLWHAAYEGPSGTEGYVSWRIKPGDDPLSSAVVQVRELAAATFEAYIALWRFVTDLDLTRTIELGRRPLDEPVRWLLADPRRMEQRVGDWLWARVINVPAALAARRYALAGRVVVDVVDPVCPWNEGRWVLEAEGEGGGEAGAASCEASCEGTDAEPDLVLGANDLGACYLGGTSFATLARAGRVAEHTPGAARRADQLFASDPRPWSQTFF